MSKLVTCVYFALAVASAAVPWEPEPRTEESWISHHERNVNNTLVNATSINVLFYGDSITDRWSRSGKPTFDKYYAPLGTANYGIGGDRTEHLLWRIQNDEVTNLSPKLCVLKIGTNNLGSNNDSDISNGILANVNELRARLPDMKLLLLGVLPRTNEELSNRTSNINSVISQVDDGHELRFLDMKQHFYRGGEDFVAELYTQDLLHLSAAGYEKWAEVMNPLFSEMLGHNATTIAEPLTIV